MDNLLSNLPVLAHALIGFYFAFFGLWSIYHWVPLLEVLAEKGIPHPYFILPVGITWQIILGTMVIFGIFIKLAALLLIPSTIIAVCIVHPFWLFKGEIRKLNFSIFMANVTISIGALLLLITPLANGAELWA